MKFVSFDVVFQEVPSEITLAVNISGCPNFCPGCHSKHLIMDYGDELTPHSLDGIILPYFESITCVCFMGGDSNPSFIEEIALHVKRKWNLKTAWYSGCKILPCNKTAALDYVKLGPYISKLGGLSARSTNQRFYKLIDGNYCDYTSIFWK